jgi:DNA-directed RNA polymerase subunit RPC12/RpoP
VTVETASTAYRCNACGKEFETEDELRRHVRRIGFVE